ncbi:MAG: SufD family Fe-S cluster assembly protein [Patescibacteria group bacterium]
MSIVIASGQSKQQVFEFINKTSEERVVVEVEKDARFKAVIILKQMNDCNIFFEVRVHEGAEAELFVLVVGEGVEKGQLHTAMVHLEPNTRANVQVKAVLDGESKLTFDGLIKILPNAQKTQSYLREDVLLLSKDAQSLGKPQLEIEANDVKASHGSTIGRIDDDQLFYLSSRGINQEDGKKAIVQGFIESILRQIPGITS